jgi:hypothetical protein
MDVVPGARSSCGRCYGRGRCGWLVGTAPLVGLGEGVGRLDPVSWHSDRPPAHEELKSLVPPVQWPVHCMTVGQCWVSWAEASLQRWSLGLESAILYLNFSQFHGFPVMCLPLLSESQESRVMRMWLCSQSLATVSVISSTSHNCFLSVTQKYE